MTTDPLRRIDLYFDAIAHASADAVDVGPLRSFVSRAPWPYYVRPRPDADLATPGSVSAADVDAAAAVLRAAGQAVSFEWVVDVAPALGPVLAAESYAVVHYPLLAVRPDAVSAPADHRVRLLADDDPAVRGALAVAEVAFAAPGTAVGLQGTAEAALAEVPDSRVEHVRGRIRSGASVLAVAVEDGAVVASGWHQPAGGVTEVVGVATLPSHRRRGLAAAVVAALVADAGAKGCDLAVLSAGDDDVARVYERVGFVRVGTSAAAEQPEPEPPTTPDVGAAEIEG